MSILERILNCKSTRLTFLHPLWALPLIYQVYDYEKATENTPNNLSYKFWKIVSSRYKIITEWGGGKKIEDTLEPKIVDPREQEQDFITCAS